MSEKPSTPAVVEHLLDEVFRRLAESATDGLLVHRDGRILWANDSAAGQVGLDSPAQLIGRSVLDFAKAVDKAPARSAPQLQPGQAR